MFGAIPPTSSSSSLKRRGPPRSASTSRSVHRSPTRTRSSAVRDGDSFTPPSYCARQAPFAVTCKSQVTTKESNDGASWTSSRHERSSGSPTGRPRSVVGVGALRAERRRRRGRAGADERAQRPARDAARSSSRTVAPPRARSPASTSTATSRVILVDTSGAPAIEWAEAAATIGLPVFALANPGGSGLRVGFGLVSGSGRSFRGPRGRRVTTSIEHNAPASARLVGRPARRRQRDGCSA